MKLKMRPVELNDSPVTLAFPNVYIKRAGKTLLVPSMVLSTLSALMLATFVPQLMPLWMALSTGSRV